jgi:outer membrane receptor protein involved in Fe transport
VVRTVYPLEVSDRLTVGLAGASRRGWDDYTADLFLGRYRLVLDRDRLPTPQAPRRIERSDTDSRDASLRTVASRGAAGGRLRVGAEAVSRFGLTAITEVELFDAAGERIAVERTPSIEDANRLDLGLFTSWDRAVGSRALFSAGLRGDRVASENRGGFFGDRSVAHEALSGHAGVVAGPFAGWTASLQAARGFRDPLLSDRYFRGPSGRGFVTGNPDLTPERSLQLDGSLRWEGGGRSLAFYGYRYRIENLVERFRDGADFFFRNRGEADLAGVELEAQAPLGRGLSAQLAATVAQGEADDGSPLDDVPSPGGWATLRWAGERGFAYTRLAAFARDDEPGPTELERPGYATLDLGAGWRLNESLELRGLARNLTDRRFFAAADETADLARGRSFSLGLVGEL